MDADGANLEQTQFGERVEDPLPIWPSNYSPEMDNGEGDAPALSILPYIGLYLVPISSSITHAAKADLFSLGVQITDRMAPIQILGLRGESTAQYLRVSTSMR